MIADVLAVVALAVAAVVLLIVALGVILEIFDPPSKYRTIPLGDKIAGTLISFAILVGVGSIVEVIGNVVS